MPMQRKEPGRHLRAGIAGERIQCNVQPAAQLHHEAAVCEMFHTIDEPGISSLSLDRQQSSRPQADYDKADTVQTSRRLKLHLD